jgi:hypothetical protein
VVRHAGGAIGCDTAAVLSEMAGLGTAEIEALHARKVIFDARCAAGLGDRGQRRDG